MLANLSMEMTFILTYGGIIVGIPLVSVIGILIYEKVKKNSRN